MRTENCETDSKLTVYSMKYECQYLSSDFIAIAIINIFHLD